MGSETGKLKFGCHYFLNSKPLISPFFRGDLKRSFEIVLDTPARISEMLYKGKLDIAFIPSIDYLRNENLSLVPNISISAYGEVKSVILLSKKEIGKIKTVAIDKKSKTSVVLLKILFKKFYKHSVKYLDDKMDNHKKADAELMIGDEALSYTYPSHSKSAMKTRNFNVIDLGSEWKRFTKLPFVFAVVAARKEIDMDFVKENMLKAMHIGLRDIADIAMKEAELAGLDFDCCYNYLSKRIRYNLGKKELEGLSRFQDLAFEIGEVKKKREI